MAVIGWKLLIVLLCQHFHAIKNQLKAPTDPYEGHFLPFSFYGIRVAWKGSSLGGFGCLELVLYGMKVLAGQFLESTMSAEEC